MSDPICLNCGAPKSAHIGGRGRSTVDPTCIEFRADEPETNGDSEPATHAFDPDTFPGGLLDAVIGNRGSLVTALGAAGVERIIERLKGQDKPDAEIARLTDELTAAHLENKHLQERLAESEHARVTAQPDTTLAELLRAHYLDLESKISGIRTRCIALEGHAAYTREGIDALNATIGKSSAALDAALAKLSGGGDPA